MEGLCLYSRNRLWNQCRVRIPLVIAMILLFSSWASAQETEQRIHRILNPDRNQASNLQSKSFSGGNAFQKSSSASSQTFNFTERYTPKGFVSKSYSNTTPYSTGKFSSHAANTKGQYEIPVITKKVDTKAVDTRAAPGSGKGYAAATGYDTREFRGRGKSQDIFDQQKKDAKPMTIDEVRELLDKNK